MAAITRVRLPLNRSEKQNWQGPLDKIADAVYGSGDISRYDADKFSRLARGLAKSALMEEKK